MKKQLKTKLPAPLDMRIAVGNNQSDFWRQVGVTQSGGSRYENGRTMPKPVRMLLALAQGYASLDELKSGELAERL